MAVNNSIRLIGRLGKDPESSSTSNGTPKATFSVAVNRTGQQKDVTDWFYVTAYGKSAENILKILHKGSQVAVEGRLETWEKNNGGGMGFGVSCEGWQALDSKGGSRSGDRDAERQEQMESASAAGGDEDEFPF